MKTESPPANAASALSRHRWECTPDRAAATAPARAAGIARYEAIVDPDGALAPDERTERAKQAFYQAMGRRSGEARRAKRAQRAQQAAMRTMDEIVDQLIAQAPTITDEQRARIQTLLTPTSL